MTPPKGDNPEGDGATGGPLRHEPRSGDDEATWSAFATAASSEAFCSAWLSLQCSTAPDIVAALLLLRDDRQQSFLPASIWPDPHRDVTRLGKAAEQVLRERTSVVLEDDEATAGDARSLIAYPVDVDGDIQGVVVLELHAGSSASLKDILRQLLWGVGWIELMLRRRRTQLDTQSLAHAATGLDLVQLAHERATLDEAAMAIVNDLATRFGADRVGLGLQRRGLLRLRAISRTAWFDRKTQLVEILENAMDEAVSQEASVSHPPLAATRGRVSVAQRDLALRAQVASVITVPLTSGGLIVGAITLERGKAPSFDAEAVKQLELAGALLGPVLRDKLERDRWFAGKAADAVRKYRDKLLGPRHPTVKLATIALAAVALFLVFAEGEFRISARTVVEGSVQRAAVVPFKSYLAEALVRAGDTVQKGQVLAVLDDRDLTLNRLKYEAEREQTLSKLREAAAKHDRSTTRILSAQLNQTDAQLSLAQEQLARTRIAAPFDGIVVSGDLSQMLGTPVEQGATLFELAPLDSYRVILKVDERDISHVTTGQSGELTLMGLSNERLPFQVRAITSVSSAQEGRNVFRVEAQLGDTPARIRPGMEGVGKILVDQRNLTWIWTRSFIDWARVALWTWLP